MQETIEGRYFEGVSSTDQYKNSSILSRLPNYPPRLFFLDKSAAKRFHPQQTDEMSSLSSLSLLVYELMRISNE